MFALVLALVLELVSAIYLTMELPKHKSVGLLTGINQDPGFFEECCEAVSYADSKETIWESMEDAPVPSLQHMLYSVRTVPPYLQLKFVKDNRFRVKKYSSVTSYSVCLDGFSNMEDYMQRHFQKKARGNALRAVRRLETCFNVRYQRFYGDIEREECENLMARLKELIQERFLERGEESHTLLSWIAITSGIYDQILSRRASLFVIYREDTPVCISVAYHYHNFFFYYITSYDTDYSRFSPGIIMLYKQLEWCFDNNYRYFDLGYGDLEYKKWWSNHIYRLEQYILIPKNSLAYYLMSSWEGNKTSFMAFLIARKVNIYYKKVLRIFKPKKENKKGTPRFLLETVQDLSSYGKLDAVDPELAPYRFLKPALFDFLYLTQNHVSEVRIYYSPGKDTFLLAGKDHFKKILFES